MARPGFAVLWSAGRTRLGLPIDGELVLGRRLVAAGDDRISGKHARFTFDGNQFTVEDLHSTNGTYVKGERAHRIIVPAGTIIRCGRTVGILVSDIGTMLESTPPWVRDVERAAKGNEHVTILGPRGSDRMRAAVAYATVLGGPSMVFDPFIDTTGLRVEPTIQTLVVVNPRLLESIDRERLEMLVKERPKLRVALSSIQPMEELGLPQRGPVVRVPSLRDDRPSIIDVMLDQLAGTGVTPHERVIEQCLLREWPGEAIEVRAAMLDAKRIAVDDSSNRIMKAHLRKTAGQPVPPGVKSFADCYLSAMKALPSFSIPDDYLVMMRSEEHEQMITSLHAIDEGPILTQADIMRIAIAPRGWFQAGFWGHGINSYAFYLAEVTDRHRALIRLPYGGGAYSTPDEAPRAVAQLARYRKFRALPPEHVKEALVVDSYDHLYDVENAEGRRFSIDRTAGLLDFEALAARVLMKSV